MKYFTKTLIIFNIVISFSITTKANSIVELGKLIQQPVREISTAYLNLEVQEFKFNKKQRGKGGAITFAGENLILGRSDCTFVRINIESWNIEENFLPPLSTGSEDIKFTKRYRYRELLPRIEGLVFYQNTYYVSYEQYDKASDYIYFVIAKFEIGNSQDKGWTTIYKSPGLDAPYFTIGSGGKLVAKDGRLFFTIGDFSLDRLNGLPSDIAPQNRFLPWGKIKYIDLSDLTSHILTMGHRNPQGLVILTNGMIIATEHGPQGGDEINLIVDGGNYGWPYKSYGTQYGSIVSYATSLPPPNKDHKFIAPLFSFMPSPAITQIIEISKFHASWGDYRITQGLPRQAMI